MVKDGQVVIVDEFTGRLMPGRRWSDGLHQAVEAKEKVKIERENQTLATITFQNYFRKYKKLSGMTGTADTEAEEFAKIYKLDVIVIPPNQPLRRIEEPDSIYRTEQEKSEAIVNDILDEAGSRPAGAGRHGLDREVRAALVDAEAARHQARRAEREVPRAGSRDSSRRPAARARSRSRRTWRAAAPTSCSAATPSSWRASSALAEENAERLPKGEERFVDDDEFVYFYHLDSFYRVPRADWERIFDALQARRPTPSTRKSSSVGGLHIIGTERHEARRIDNQLRGRAGRQGDPGLVALLPVARRRPDAHLRIRPHRRADAAPRMEEGVPIEHGMVTQAPSSARRSRWRRRTSASASTCSSTTT